MTIGRVITLVIWTFLCVLVAVFAVLGLSFGDCAPEVVDCHPRGPLNIALTIIGAGWLLITSGTIRSWRRDVQ